MSRFSVFARSLLICFFILGGGACSEPNPKLIDVPPRPPQKPIRDLGERILYNPNVDILFVIDDSGSMDRHQTNLAKNVSLFTSEIQKYSAMDFRIGVVNSSIGGTWGGKYPGDGKLVGKIKYVDRNTPAMNQVLAENMMVGTGGSSNEEFFRPVTMALSQPNLGGWNAGFYRTDAYLLVVFITDAEDLGPLSAQDFYDTLVKLKGGDKTKVLANAAFIPTTDRTCDRSGELPPKKIEAFLGLAGGTSFGLCDADFGVQLAGIGKLVVEKIANVIALTRPPVPETIRITFGTQVVPNSSVDGWMFDPSKNAIVFGPGLQWSKQPKGTQVEVFYVPVDPPEEGESLQ